MKHFHMIYWNPYEQLMIRALENFKIGEMMKIIVKARGGYQYRALFGYSFSMPR